MTQAELASVLRISPPYVSSLETGNENPTVGQLWAIADALRVEIHLDLRDPPPLDAPPIPDPPRP
jgi:transcriptional regulator with XRE-family HTH domain